MRRERSPTRRVNPLSASQRRYVPAVFLRGDPVTKTKWAGQLYFCANCRGNHTVAFAWLGSEAILRCEACGFSSWEALLANAQALDIETKTRRREIAAEKAAVVRKAKAEAKKGGGNGTGRN